MFARVGVKSSGIWIGRMSQAGYSVLFDARLFPETLPYDINSILQYFDLNSRAMRYLSGVQEYFDDYAVRRSYGVDEDDIFNFNFIQQFIYF